MREASNGKNPLKSTTNLLVLYYLKNFPIPVTLATSKFFIVTAPFGPVISIVSVRPPIAVQMTLKVLFLLLTAPILADMLKTVVKILRQLSRTQRPYLDNRFPQTQWICHGSCN